MQIYFFLQESFVPQTIRQRIICLASFDFSVLEVPAVTLQLPILLFHSSSISLKVKRFFSCVCGGSVSDYYD